jgi:hypothetical protein
MSFRDKLSRAFDWMAEERIRRTAGVPRGGQGWCMEVAVCKDRALLKSAVVANKGGVPFWLWICDSPTTQDRPTCAPIYVPALTTQALDWTAAPRLMSQGIFVLATTDPETKTLIATPDAWFEVAYEPVR